MIRKMTETDIEPLYNLLTNPKVMEYIEPPYTREQTERFLKSAGLMEPPLVYAVEEDGSFIGYVIYHDYDEGSVEIGWVLNTNYWNRGYASRLTEELIERAKLSHKDIVIECAPEQHTTKRIADKFGFQYEGTIDGLEMFRLRRDDDDD